MNSTPTCLTKKFSCEKLARDFIESSYQKTNIKSSFRVIKKEELLQAFKVKIVEEAEEVLEADSRADLIEELSDLMEVIESFMKTAKINSAELKNCRKIKKSQRGGFEKGFYLEYIEVPLDSPDFSKYSSRPHKYPVIT